MSDAPIRSRRAVLGAALGGAAAVAAHSLARPLPAAAVTGDPALIGTANSGDAATSFENTDDGETSLAGLHGAAGTGVDASSVAGTGLNATSATGPAIMAISTDATPSDGTVDPSHRNGIFAAVGDITDAPTVTDEAGVFGYADVSVGSAGVAGQSFQGSGVIGLGDTGVTGLGATQGILAIGSWGIYATGAVGIVGDVDSTGVGVYGFAGASDIPNPPTGIGVYARAGTNSQLALRVQGRAKFSRSGRVSMRGATKTVHVSGISRTGTLVVATLQTNVSGLHVTSVVPATNAFKIHLSRSPGKSVSVGWIAFEKP
ncbi:MAG TPA: hypothetical protein VIZ22_11225 [Candidatus Limnocylindrales bacterium]